MIPRFLRSVDPFVQLVVLISLAFLGVALSAVAAYGLINVLWGVDLFSHPEVLTQYTNPQIVNINRVLLMFQHLGLFILPAIVFAALASNHPRRYLQLATPPPAPFLWAAFVLTALSIVPINFLASINEQMQLPAALSGVQDWMQQMETNADHLSQVLITTKSTSTLVFNLIVVSLLPAIGEELIFRGVLLKILTRWSGKMHAGVWISAIVFSALHLQFYGFLPRLVMGVMLGYLAVWSGSLIPSMLVHFLNNSFAILLAFAETKGWVPQSVDTFGGNAGQYSFALVLCGLFILAMWLTSKMSHWSHNRQIYLYGN